MKVILFFLYTTVLLFSSFLSAMTQTEDIRLNQVGFYPDGPKMAIVVDTDTDDFFLTNQQGQDTVYAGKLSASQYWSYSGEQVKPRSIARKTLSQQVALEENTPGHVKYG